MFKKYLYVFLISMVPIIELRGAVPAGTAMGLPWIPTLLIAIVGNCIPVPFILIFIRSLLSWMHKVKHLDKIATWIDGKAEKNRERIEKYAGWGLLLFVAIPIPGTGAWTGSLVAAMFNMNKKKACLCIFLGVIIAGLIMTVLSLFFKGAYNALFG